MTTHEERLRVAAELDRREASISRRLDALQTEASSLGANVQSAIEKSPLIAAGGAVMAGLLLGALVGKPKRPGAATQLSRDTDAIAEEIRRLMDRGRDPESAVRAALAGHAPIIIRPPDAGQPSSKAGLVAQLLNLTFKTLIAFAVKSLADVLAERFQLEQRIAELTSQGPPASHGPEDEPEVAAPVAAVDAS